jgi:hypothetical protein
MDETETEKQDIAGPERAAPSRALRFAREHPSLTIAAATGIGLFGGIEVAAGVLFGASIAVLVVGRGAADRVRHRAREFIRRVRGEAHAQRAETHS